MRNRKNPSLWSLFGLCVLALSCTSTNENSSNNQSFTLPDGFSRIDILESVANNVILPAHDDFVDETYNLKRSLDAYLIALSLNPQAPLELRAARAAWKKTMYAWQRLEIFQVGPLGDKATRVAGQNIRDEVYSWPTVSTCSVDKELVYNRFEDSSFFSQTLINAYGLDAMEYLLFEESTENTCNVLSDINSSSPRWSDLSVTELRLRRAKYAYRIAQHLKVEADRLRNLWASPGYFVRSLTNPGSSSSDFETDEEALNELFAALYYLELVVKDDKLALPAGLTMDCMEMNCPERLESRWAKHSRENVIANLKSFRAAFVGGDENDPSHIGFDDFLVAVNSAELATQMLSGVDQVIALLEGQTLSFYDALGQQSTNLVDAHDQLKLLTDVMKTQFVSVLGLKVPREGAGDND